MDDAMKNLRKVRLARGISVKACLEATGTKRRMWERYEKCTSSPPLKTQIKIADFLGCTLDELAGRHVNPEVANVG
jgi:transcriptional regulator with XRE-family HTH domain